MLECNDYQHTSHASLTINMPRFSPFLSTCFLFATAAMASAEEIDFARDIRQILSDNCYHCHGPDEGAREAELRLDTKEGLFRNLDGTTVVAPGNVDASELIRRVVSNESDERMPPADSNRSLTPKQIGLLTKWVENGAVWKGHWSFQPPVQPEVPKGKNAIDYFVVRRLEQAGMKPSVEASKERLLRRVTFDLTGLPPTIEELDAFLSDDSQAAFEKVVDRLLTSRHYG